MTQTTIGAHFHEPLDAHGKFLAEIAFHRTFFFNNLANLADLFLGQVGDLLGGLDVDDDYVFVGSFNVDLRSAWLNCEMGVMVRSDSLAARFNALVDAHANPATSYAVRLGPRGQLRWAHREAGVDEQLEREPHASFSRRTLAWLARILPLQRQL